MCVISFISSPLRCAPRRSAVRNSGPGARGRTSAPFTPIRCTGTNVVGGRESSRHLLRSWVFENELPIVVPVVGFVAAVLGACASVPDAVWHILEEVRATTTRGFDRIRS